MTRDLMVEQVSIEDLLVDPLNPRTIAAATLEALTRWIRQLGLVDPLIARRESLQLIGGHQRLVAARKAGLDTVPVVLVDIDADGAQLLGIALNRIQGEWDDDLLARVLHDLDAKAHDPTVAGFSRADLTALFRQLEVRERRDRPEAFDLEAALADSKTRTTRVQPGDVWQLGPHRLWCGDATDLAGVEHLMAGAQAGMAFTDPPYNVALGQNGGNCTQGM